MSCGKNKVNQPSDAPLTEAEFNAWWPFSDDDLDDYEKEIEASLSDYEPVLPLHLEAERQESRAKVRRLLSEKYPNDIPGQQNP